jgi:hypothetical protein
MKLNNVYQKLATTSAQIWNSRALFIASFALTTLSAIATAYVNAMAHETVIGRKAAIGLAVLIFCIAEGTLLISNHGLLNVYTNNRQRMWAALAYWLIKAAMWLNIAILCCYLGQIPLPYWLAFWNKWSIALHAAIGLILIDLIRNNDSIKQFKMAELRSATAEQDAMTARLLKSYSSGIIWASALRGVLDGLLGAWKILRISSGFPKNIAERIQNVIDGRQQNVRQNVPQNVTGGRQQNVRLVGPVTTQAPLRTSAPPASPSAPTSPNVPNLRSGTGTNLAGLPDLPNVRWELNRRGGYEAWYVPPEATRRDQNIYLGYLGKRQITRWTQQNILDAETERWVEQKKVEAGV